MKKILYGRYEIVATATAHNGTWRPHGCISWDAQSQPHLIDVADISPFKTESEAVEYAFQLGKEWVHRHVHSKRRRRVFIREH